MRSGGAPTAVGTTLRPGDRVQHLQHGAGRVIALRAGRARVKFDARPGLPEVVPYDALLREGTAAGAGAASVVRADAVRDSRRAVGADAELQRAAGADAEAWQAVEALRLGVVPFERAAAYTVGREDALAGLHEMLEGGAGMRVLLGDYGHGKTHLLDLFEHAARAAGYATARATLDPAEVPPSHPKRLYHALMAGFRCPDAPDPSPGPLFERLRDSAAHLERDGARYSRFLTPALRAHRDRTNTDLHDQMRDYVLGHAIDAATLDAQVRYMDWTDERLLALSDFRTYGRVYGHLLGTWATWCRDAGYRGLVVLLDEAERMTALDAEHRRLASEVMAHYAAATLPRDALAFEPERLYRGGHAALKALPLRFAADQPLSAVLALTRDPLIEAQLRTLVGDASVRIELQALRPEVGAALVGRVTDLYRAAYPGVQIDAALLQRLHRLVAATYPFDAGVPRRIVRATVSLLDCLRHGTLPLGA